MKYAHLACSSAIALILGGCNYVQLSDAGSAVAQASAADVVNCENAGTVSANTKSRVVFKRPSAKVREELIVLARNRAADLGANAIIPEAAPINGVQRFLAYKCN
jgi:hypothetical protein